MERGKKYKWKYSPEIMIYVGYNWSGNGYWHQFELEGKQGKIWCEVQGDQLNLIEEVKDS